MDIKPPKKNDFKIPAAKGVQPKQTKPGAASVKSVQAKKTAPLPETLPAPVIEEPPQKGLKQLKKKSNKWKWGFAGVLAVLLLITVFISWAFLQMIPADSSGNQRRITIDKGAPTEEISDQLESAGLIRSSYVFNLYLRVTGAGSNVKAGTYVLSPAQSMKDIVDHLVDGKIDPLHITVVPGLTLNELKEEFLEYGYTEEEIDDAFSRKYSHPLLGAKPKSADLEGYIYPETYQIEGTSDLTELITRSFDEFYKKLKEEDAIKKLKARNMNLHQAIILASIIQQEVADPKEQKQVSQVFQKRLAMDMALESDATFVYAAKRLGVEPRVGLESPYNTRIHKGLTPGPIANFNFSAIKAVYEPAPGEFIYFVSGDDGITRFSKTPEEHQEKIDKYCKKLCEMF